MKNFLFNYNSMKILAKFKDQHFLGKCGFKADIIYNGTNEVGVHVTKEEQSAFLIYPDNLLVNEEFNIVCIVKQIVQTPSLSLKEMYHGVNLTISDEFS